MARFLGQELVEYNTNVTLFTCIKSKEREGHQTSNEKPDEVSERKVES